MISFRSKLGAAGILGGSAATVGPRAPGITTTIVEDAADLRALGTEWNGLFSACERPSACAGHAWVTEWWSAFGHCAHGAGVETNLFVVMVRDSVGLLIGIAPFFEERPRGLFRVRRLRIVGFLGHDGAFDMTEEPTFLALPGHEARVLNAVAEALRPGLASGRWDAAYFRVHSDDAPLRKAFGLLRSCAFLRTDARSGSDYADLPESWQAYRKALTKSMRDNLGYYPRLLTRDGHDWRVRVVREPGEMAAAADRLADLHRGRAESGKGERHDDHIHGPAQRAFLGALLRRLAATGEAYVGELLVDGRVVAAQAFVESGDELMVYYSGYDEAWYRYSPVFVIDSVVFKEALERGVRRLNFLRNIAPWKTRWLARPGPRMHRAVLVSHRVDGLLRYGVQACRQAFRRNVVARLPVMRRRLADRARPLLGRGGIGRLRSTLSLLPPLVGRVGDRFAPTVHLAVAHHRVLMQIPLHR